MPSRKGSVRKNKERMKCAKCLYRVGLGVKEIARILGIGGHNSVKRMLQRSKIYGTRNGVHRSGFTQRDRIKEQARLKREETFSTFRPGTQLEWKGFGVRTKAEYHRQRYRNDRAFNLRTRLARRLRKVFDKGCCGESTSFFIGCGMRHLVRHIQSQFQAGMSWTNYGEWHIDHILPCSSFNLFDIHHAMMCFNWRNLRPMWGADNIRKKDKYSKGNWNQYVKQFKNGVWIGNDCVSTGSLEARVKYTNSNQGQ